MASAQPRVEIESTPEYQRAQLRERIRALTLIGHLIAGREDAFENQIAESAFSAALLSESLTLNAILVARTDRGAEVLDGIRNHALESLAALDATTNVHEKEANS